ncbi:MAG: aldo/keto reductase [Bifidobacteriaceae bacterium]|jgi:2,5-diketo-D-gluconate reductase A|nr:aldo/keto reductase [Bifidobacteriaceae bacterium]
MTDLVPRIALNQGPLIPQLGFGVFLVDPAMTQKTVESALEVGYRHIDTATGYNNEAQVGAAIRASGLKREDIFVTTKLRNDHHKARDIKGAYQRSLDALDIGYLDLYLIHWPMPLVGYYVEAWKLFEGFLAEGTTRAIGVSNFKIPHLQRLMAETSVVPALNQVELHPVWQQKELRAFQDQHGIKAEAWAPLGQGRYPLDSIPAINAAAAAHGKTPAQVMLRWHMQEGIIAIPKANSREHQAANLDIFDFELTPAEMAAIQAADGGHRLAVDPDDVNSD